MSNTLPPFNTLPLPPEAQEDALNRWGHLQNTLRTTSPDDVNPARAMLYHSAQQALQALEADVGKMHSQHQSCRPGASGTKHTDLGACSLDTRWEPKDDLGELCQLRGERIQDLEASEAAGVSGLGLGAGTAAPALAGGGPGGEYSGGEGFEYAAGGVLG